MSLLNFKVEEANTYVRIFDFDQDTYRRLGQFCLKHLALWAKVQGPTYGSHRWERTHVFATFSKDKTQLRLAKGLYPQLVEFMAGKDYQGPQPEVIQAPVITPHPARFRWRNKTIKPRNQDQEDFVNFILTEEKALVVINGSTGFGKALRNSTRVQTPTGWVPIGEINVDDEVIAVDGSVTQVTGVYPQGILPVNKVIFGDDRTIFCCDDHLWKIFDERNKRWSVIDTRELKELTLTIDSKVFIPTVNPYGPEEGRLFLDPYLVGILLGNEGFCKPKSRCFISYNRYAIDCVIEKLAAVDCTLERQGDTDRYNIVSKVPGEDNGKVFFFDVILDLMIQVYPIHRRIPEVYLNAPVEQRFELLRGLMLSRGKHIRQTLLVYEASEFSFAHDVKRLAHSLGGIARVGKAITTYDWSKSPATEKKVYPVEIRMRKPETIITSPRERERFPVGASHARPLKLSVRTVKPAGHAACTCISVSHPDKLFVVEDFIPTHNTVVAIISFFKMGYRVLITVLPRFVSIWVAALNRFAKLKPQDVLNISDHDINDVYEALKEKRIDPKIVFFQLTRINTYIKRSREEPDSLPPLDEFFNAIGAGVRIIDEAHESIYMVYSSLLYGNFKKNIAISATLYADSEFTNKIYNGTFPASCYLRPPTYEKYMHVVSYYHRMNNQRYRINTKGFGGYSHSMYENGIMRNGKIFERYYQMCKGAFEKYYIQGKREGQKAMWFFATIAMGERFVNRLKRDYPELDIFLFAGDILKKKGMELEYANHEVVVTTPGSCSTGKDVAKLYIVFSGVSVSSSQRVEQMSGRTRPIHEWWPDLDPIFLTFVCRDIAKQVEYDRKKKATIGKKTKKFTSIESGYVV